VTIVTFASVKGAPGVTTLASLVGATWPAGRQALLVECDPSGGDLAARFRLSSRTGWSSLLASSRRSASMVALEPHLQRLPGGLDVLVSPVGPRPESRSIEWERACLALRSWAGGAPDTAPRDLLLDLGRLCPGDERSEEWLHAADRIVLCMRSDGASAMQLAVRVGSDLARWRECLGLVVVGTDGYSGRAIEKFTGVPVVAEILFDSRSASIADGARKGERRLGRSSLAAESKRLALALAPPTLTRNRSSIGDPGLLDDSAVTRKGRRWWAENGLRVIDRIQTARRPGSPDPLTSIQIPEGGHGDQNHETTSSPAESPKGLAGEGNQRQRQGLAR
jgi:hypothetical protein